MGHQPPARCEDGDLQLGPVEGGSRHAMAGTDLGHIMREEMQNFSSSSFLFCFHHPGPP